MTRGTDRSLQPDGWGFRARIGLLVPHNDVVPESELRAIAPDGVSIHAARVPFGWRGDVEAAPLAFDAARAFAEPPHIDDLVELLVDAPLNVIAYAFTSSSYVSGPDGDREMQRRLERRSRGIPVLVPCLSAVAALRSLDARKLALIHPPWFTPELDHEGAEYFRQHGMDVVQTVSVRLPKGQLNVDPAEVLDWVCAHLSPGAESVFVGGNGFRAVGMVQELERRVGLPVLTANQVLLWHALRFARVAAHPVGYGRIFTRDLPDER